jgi:hypothetical protein
MRGRSSTSRDDIALIEATLDAIDAETLRLLVRELARRTSTTDRAWLLDELLRRVRRDVPGWQLPVADPRLLADVAECMRRTARYDGDPCEVDDLLRRAGRALVSGDPAAARSTYDQLLPALLDGEIGLHYDELLEEVLEVDLFDAALCWLAATYLTTPISERPTALLRVLDHAWRMTAVTTVIEGMERVSGQPLPDLDEFVPSWIAALDRATPRNGAWNLDVAAMKREAILVQQGVDGLGRQAKRSKSPDDYRAWIEALVAQERWDDAYTAVLGAARQLKKPHQAAFFDAAATLARRRGGDDLAHLEAAWRALPTVARFLRVVDRGAPNGADLRKRALEASKGVRASPRLDAVIAIATANVEHLVSLVSTATALGWSGDHPSWIAFPALVRIVGGVAPEGTARHEVCVALGASDDGFMEPLDEMHYGLFDPFDNAGPRSLAPREPISIATLIERAQLEVDADAAPTIYAALRKAAERRLGGILKNQRRRHYGSVATLVACCVELDGRADAWLARVRDQGRRYPAFRSALDSALAGKHLTTRTGVGAGYADGL